MSLATLDTKVKLPTRKHLAERQRRARINHLLEQLEVLISSADTESNPVKLEKAEVLERTVEYIKRLNVSCSDTMTTYMFGYMKCIERINKFLSEQQLPENVQCSIQSYLMSSIRTGSASNETETDKSEQFVLPANNDRSGMAQKDYTDSFSSNEENVQNKIQKEPSVWRPW